MSAELKRAVRTAALAATYDGEVISLDGLGRPWMWVRKTQATVQVKTRKGVVMTCRRKVVVR